MKLIRDSEFNAVAFGQITHILNLTTASGIRQVAPNLNDEFLAVTSENYLALFRGGDPRGYTLFSTQIAQNLRGIASFRLPNLTRKSKFEFKYFCPAIVLWYDASEKDSVTDMPKLKTRFEIARMQIPLDQPSHTICTEKFSFTVPGRIVDIKGETNPLRNRMWVLKEYDGELALAHVDESFFEEGELPDGHWRNYQFASAKICYLVNMQRADAFPFKESNLRTAMRAFHKIDPDLEDYAVYFLVAKEGKQELRLADQIIDARYTGVETVQFDGLGTLEQLLCLPNTGGEKYVGLRRNSKNVPILVYYRGLELFEGSNPPRLEERDARTLEDLLPSKETKIAESIVYFGGRNHIYLTHGTQVSRFALHF